MRTLSRLLLGQFLPVLVISLLFFVMVIELLDLFSNLSRYLNLEVEVRRILQAQLLYLPKSISFALPVAVLFAGSYALGLLYSNNELIAVLASGVSLRRFVLPLIVSGFLLSVFSFAFEETVVIDTLERKNRLTRELLVVNRSFSNTDVTLVGRGNRVVYHADYYDDGSETISGLTVVLRDAMGAFERRIDADWAEYVDGQWVLHDTEVFTLEAGNDMERTIQSTFTDASLDSEPDSFRRRTQDIEEMQIEEARRYINELRQSGLSYRAALTDYYERYSFALTPFVVTLISSIVGSRFRKNILLMSLLVSLSLAVVYYITGLVTGLMATNGLIPPWAGAWSAFVFFLIITVVGFRYART